MAGFEPAHMLMGKSFNSKPRYIFLHCSATELHLHLPVFPGCQLHLFPVRVGWSGGRREGQSLPNQENLSRMLSCLNLWRGCEGGRIRTCVSCVLIVAAKRRVYHSLIYKCLTIQPHPLMVRRGGGTPYIRWSMVRCIVRTPSSTWEGILSVLPAFSVHIFKVRVSFTWTPIFVITNIVKLPPLLHCYHRNKLML